MRLRGDARASLAPGRFTHGAVAIGAIAAIAASALLSACGARPAAPPPAAAPEAGQPVYEVSGHYAPASLPATDSDAPTLTAEIQAALPLTLPASPALTCLAHEHARWFAATASDPDIGTVDRMAARCGYWTRPARTLSVTAPGATQLIEHFRRLPLSEADAAIALGTARHTNGRLTGVLLFDSGEVRLDPIPRAPRGATAIRGRLGRGEGTAELWVDDGAGPKRQELAVDPTGNFNAELSPGDSGRLDVELVRRSGRFRRTIALLHLGVEPAALSEADAMNSRPTPPTVAEQGHLESDGAHRHSASAVVHAVNAARSARGLPPLSSAVHLRGELDDWLARAHGQREIEAPAGLHDDRGVPASRLRYALTTGRDAAQAVEVLLASPTGRRVLLDARDDLLAVGARPYPRGDGLDLVLVSLRRHVDVAPAVARSQALERLNAARAGRDLPPLQLAGALSDLAHPVAEEFLGGRLAWRAVVPTVMEAVRTGRPVRGEFGAGAFITPEPGLADFSTEERALDPAATVAGLAVLGGVLPGGGPPRFVVIYIVAQALAPPPS